MSAVAKIPAVVTAGGRISGPLADRAGTTIKGLAPVGGVPLLARVVGALRACPAVGEIVVVGPKAEIEAVACQAGANTVLDEGATGPENVQAGLAQVAPRIGDGQVLLCASDTPFLHADTIAALLAAPGVGDADIVFPVVTRADYEAVFPNAPNVWARLERTDLTGGSVQLVRPAALARNRALIEKVFAARKSQIQMALLLGLGFAVQFKLGTLTIARAEKRASELTGCDCRALLRADPRLAADIDDLADYEWALRHAEGLANGPH